MKTTKNNPSEATIFGLSEVSKATRLEADTVLQLYAKGLFPDPLHHHPPLWSATAVMRWVHAAATNAEIDKSAKHAARTRSCVTVQRRRAQRAT